ncbi:MAG: DUF1254 domain-containing protein [Parachlamydiales bacterium]|jgi:hypothetical protein
MKVMLLATFCIAMLGISTSDAAPQSISPEEAKEIALEAYIYAYPIVLMQITRDVGTNVSKPTELHAPINQLAHARTFPDPSFTDVVRPNADTLYTALNYDVSNEPLIVSVPSSEGRYFLLPWLDWWTDVFTAPGSRTTGNDAQIFAIVGPGWNGTLPDKVRVYRSPTAFGLLIGRTQTNGKGDYEAVHKFQDGMQAVPLSSYGKPYSPPKGIVNPNQDMSSPPEQIDKMNAKTFFTIFTNLLKANPPHENDYPIIDQLKRIGIEPGKDFSFDTAPKDVQDALNAAPLVALKQIKEVFLNSGIKANGWRTNLTAIGTYGTDYLHRAGVAYAGLGANVIQDAVYPTAFSDSNGEPFNSDRQYVLHFDKAQIPPVRGFWSLTMYDQRQLFTPNPIDRYAIGDRDNLIFNPDGSLDLYIQRESPGKDKESNWLPAPSSGPFTMNLRLYWPKSNALDGSWVPPPVKRLG